MRPSNKSPGLVTEVGLFNQKRCQKIRIKIDNKMSMFLCELILKLSEHPTFFVIYNLYLRQNGSAAKHPFSIVMQFGSENGNSYLQKLDKRSLIVHNN